MQLCVFVNNACINYLLSNFSLEVSGEQNLIIIINMIIIWWKYNRVTDTSLQTVFIN